MGEASSALRAQSILLCAESQRLRVNGDQLRQQARFALRRSKSQVLRSHDLLTVSWFHRYWLRPGCRPPYAAGSQADRVTRHATPYYPPRSLPFTDWLRPNKQAELSQILRLELRLGSRRAEQNQCEGGELRQNSSPDCRTGTLIATNLTTSTPHS
jgi:hypothetical protein